MLLETRSFQFSEFLLDLKEKVLLRDRQPVSITPKAFLLLQTLVENHGHLVEKDRLMKTVWPDSFVEEGNLSFTVNLLRKVLADNKEEPRFIETVPKRGYRFVAPVEEFPVDSVYDIGANGFPAVNGTAIDISQKPAAIVNGNGEPGFSSSNESAEKSFISNAAVSTARMWRTRSVLLVSLVIIIAVFALTSALLNRPASPLANRLNNLRVEKLSSTGNSSGAAISPDGKLIAYSTIEAGKPVIWLRQLSTGKSLQIMPPSEQMISGLRFSKDGEYLDYFHSQGTAFMDVSRISILGGTPTKVLSRVHGGYTFSPDEKKVAFARRENGTSSIFVANADGSDEQLLISAPGGLSINCVSWAPDGNSIAYSTGKYPSRGLDFSIHEYDLASGSVRLLTESRWNDIGSLMWLPDKSGILASGSESADGIGQIWLVSLPNGETKQISFGTASLKLRGATLDFSKLLASENTLVSKIWFGKLADPSTIGAVSRAQHDLALSKDGTIVFPATDASTPDIWISNADGTGRRQLTADKAVERRPAVSPDGRFIAYVVNDHGKHNVWRMDIDGRNPVRLTDGEGEDYPTFTPDGRFVVYNSLADGNLMKVPVESGEPTVVFKDRAIRAAVSPDGRSFAYIGLKDNERKLIVRSLDGGALLKEFPVPGRHIYAPKVVWTADGGSILFTVTDENNTANIFGQRLDNSPPEKLTDFGSEQIFDFSLSADGSQIAMVRGSWNFDTVLLTPVLD